MSDFRGPWKQLHSNAKGEVARVRKTNLQDGVVWQLELCPDNGRVANIYLTRDDIGQFMESLVRAVDGPDAYLDVKVHRPDG